MPTGAARPSRVASGTQPRGVEELVAVEHALLVPRRVLDAKGEAHPLAAAERPLPAASSPSARAPSGAAPAGSRRRAASGGRRASPPRGRSRTSAASSRRRGAAPRRVPPGPRQRQVADRDQMRAEIARPGMAAAVAESVELLDIAERQRRLLLDPGAEPHVEGAVKDRVERAERQAVRLGRIAGGDDQDQRLAARRRRRSRPQGRSRSVGRPVSTNAAYPASAEREGDVLGGQARRGRSPATAATMRPFRPRMSSPIATMRGLG